MYCCGDGMIKRFLQESDKTGTTIVHTFCVFGFGFLLFLHR